METTTEAARALYRVLCWYEGHNDDALAEALDGETRFSTLIEGVDVMLGIFEDEFGADNAPPAFRAAEKVLRDWRVDFETKFTQ